MKIKSVLSVAQAESFCDTYEALRTPQKPDGTSIQALRNAIGDNKSSSVITRWCLFYKLHGREKFIDYFARAKGPEYTDQDYLQILEYAVTSGTPIDRTWVIFACSRRKLEKLSARRKRGHQWPQVEPATPPQKIVRLLDEETLSARLSNSTGGAAANDDDDDAAGNAEASQDSKQGKGSILDGDAIVANGSTAQTVKEVTPHKLIHGKSKQVEIQPYRQPYKPRNKAIVAAKKQQQAILQAKANAIATKAKLTGASALTPALQTTVEPSSNIAIAPLPDELFALIKADLKDPSTYDPLRRGRKPYFNPLADGFALLPESVRKSSLAYYKLMEKAYLEATLAAKQVSATATKAELFTVCQAFMQEHSTYPLKVAIIPFGFKYENYRYYEKYRPANITAEDPYLVSGAYDALLDCAMESNFEKGKYRLRQTMYERGYHYCVPTIAKLMKRCGIVATTGGYKYSSRKYSSYMGTVGTLAPNLLQRDFNADAPFQKIVSDVTEVPVPVMGDKVYLSIFLDLFNNEIRSYSISLSPSVQFVVAGLKKLLPAIPQDAHCIIHTDQGHQYQREAYRSLFEQNTNIVQSMSRKGNCYDNGACEAWFSRFKDEAIKGTTFSSIDELVAAIERYIVYYNNERIQMGLNGKSPVAYAQMIAAQNAA